MCRDKLGVMASEDYFRQIVEFERLPLETRIIEIKKGQDNTKYTYPIIHLLSLGDKENSLVILVKNHLMSKGQRKIKDPEIIRFALELYKLAKPVHRRRIVQISGVLFGSGCTPILEEAIMDLETKVRLAAIYALEEVISDHWKDIIMSALKDEDSMVRFSSINFISMKLRNNPNFRISVKLRRLIADLMEDKDELVVLSANNLLKELSVEKTIMY